MQDAGFEHAHSSPIKTWQQLVVVVALAFVIPVIGIILLTQFITSDRKTDPATLAPEAVAARIQPVARVVFADASAPAGALKSGEETYKAVCAACHGQGIAGAPKVGDNAAWAPHLKDGLATLVKNAINGMQSPKGVMPPRGGNPSLSDWEMHRRDRLHGEPVGRELQGAAEARGTGSDRCSGPGGGAPAAAAARAAAPAASAAAPAAAPAADGARCCRRTAASSATRSTRRSSVRPTRRSPRNSPPTRTRPPSSRRRSRAAASASGVRCRCRRTRR